MLVTATVLVLAGCGSEEGGAQGGPSLDSDCPTSLENSRVLEAYASDGVVALDDSVAYVDPRRNAVTVEAENGTSRELTEPTTSSRPRILGAIDDDLIINVALGESYEVRRVTTAGETIWTHEAESGAVLMDPDPVIEVGDGTYIRAADGSALDYEGPSTGDLRTLELDDTLEIEDWSPGHLLYAEPNPPYIVTAEDQDNPYSLPGDGQVQLCGDRAYQLENQGYEQYDLVVYDITAEPDEFTRVELDQAPDDLSSVGNGYAVLGLYGGRTLLLTD